MPFEEVFETDNDAETDLETVDSDDRLRVNDTA